jgi:hypothetical protein
VNGWSDEVSAVAVRPFNVFTEGQLSPILRAKALKSLSLTSSRAGVIIGSRKGFREKLKAMTIASGVKKSESGGAWSMESNGSRLSYVFANFNKGNVDDWIDFAQQYGFSIIHFASSWARTLGHYEINTNAFPGGIEEMKSAVGKIHDSGLKATMHTLTGCISINDSWITPVCREDLVSDAVYTLSAPLKVDSKELLVEEKPIPKHSTVLTYSSNGNALRIGNEIIQYSGIRFEKPYAFTGIKRGALKTVKGGEIPAGTKVHYLHQRYMAFYPDPDGRLADELTDRIAYVHNYCGFDGLYFDGSEGMGTRYGIDAMRHKLYPKLKSSGHSPYTEASCQGANNWWFHTRMATTDHPVWGAKRFHDWHIKWAIDGGRNSNFLASQMGWWSPRAPCAFARGHHLDEMEYFASKNAGYDAAMSVQGVASRPLPTGVRRQLTLLGWYERPRLAQAFTPEAAARMREEGKECRLRQNENGEWILTDVDMFVHRVSDDSKKSWKVESSRKTLAAARVEALYSAGNERRDSTNVIFSAKSFSGAKKSAAKGVKVKVSELVDKERGAVLSIEAKNESAVKNASWAMVSRSADLPGISMGKDMAFGLWIKGDGSGALANILIQAHREYLGGCSEHYLRLDFTGWRYVKFLIRERDASEFYKYKWPYGGHYSIYRNSLNTMHLGSVSVLLNDIEKGTTCKVEFGDVVSLAVSPAKIEKPKLVLNGKAYEVPFTLLSGDYAELENGEWIHYSDRGDFLGKAKAAQIEIDNGENVVAFDCSSKDARAEVSLALMGEKRKALKNFLTDDMRFEMRHEAVEPFAYAPSKGFDGRAKISLRPGEKAQVGIEIYGNVKKPVVGFEKPAVRCQFDVDVKKGQVLKCRDGKNWKLCLSNGTVLKSGVLARPLPVIEGCVGISIESDASTDCVIDLIKHYVRFNTSSL